MTEYPGPKHLLNSPVSSMAELYSAHCCYPTSDVGDELLIRSHIAYHWGFRQAQQAVIRRSRGHSMRVELDGDKYICRVVNPHDHREGVTGFPH